MMNKTRSYDPVRYPIVIQVLNDQVIASQPDLDIYRVRGKFSSLRKKEEIGAIILDTIEEAMNRLRDIPNAVPRPSSAKEATYRLKKQEASHKTVKRYMTVAYAAKVIGVSSDTVLRMCRRKELDYRLTPGGHHRIFVNQRNLRVLDSGVFPVTGPAPIK